MGSGQIYCISVMCPMVSHSKTLENKLIMKINISSAFYIIHININKIMYYEQCFLNFCCHTIKDTFTVHLSNTHIHTINYK